MSLVKALVVLAGVGLGVVALAASASGGEQHIVLSRPYPVSGLSVPVPAGFRHRFFSEDDSEGITISDGAGSLATSRWNPERSPWRSNQVTLSVYEPGFSHEPPPATMLRFPVTRDDLGCASGGLPLCGVGGQIPIRSANGYQVETQQIGIELWLGKRASERDRLAILAALEAIELGPPAA